MTEVPKHIDVMARAIYGPRPVSFDAASQGQRDCCIKEATAAVAALVEAGFAIVPREPTEAMFEKGRKAWKAPRLHVSHTASDEFMTCGVIYRAMIEAAVKP